VQCQHALATQQEPALKVFISSFKIPQLRTLLFCLLLIFSFSDAHGFFWKPNLGPISKTEKSLQDISLKILAEIEAKNRESADQKVLKLFDKGRKVWSTSPSNRRNLVAVGGDPVYEAGVLVDAMMTYYDATGRPGLAISYLVEAASEVRQMREYQSWIDLSEELIRRFGALGLVDEKRKVFEEVMRFFRRLDLVDKPSADPSSPDTVLFLKWIGFAVAEGDLLDDRLLLESYDLFETSIKQGLKHWGWAPDIGFEFLRVYPQFLLAMARNQDPRLDFAVKAYQKSVDWNDQSDPLLVAADQKSTTGIDQLGNSLFQYFSLRTSHLMSWSEGILNFRTTNPEQRRFLLTSQLFRDLVLADVAQLEGQPKQALDLMNSIEERFHEIEISYGRFEVNHFESDGLGIARRNAQVLKAEALEDLGLWTQAADVYRDHVTWSELARDSLSVEERLHFFRGKALPAYLGLIRSLAHLALIHEDDDSISRLLTAIDRVKGRQILELMGADTGQESLTTHDVQQALSGNKGLLVFQDLEDSLLVLVVSERHSRLQLINKDQNWDPSLFALRNRLAESADFDRRAFQELSRTLLAFAEDAIAPLDLLFVLNDGALTSIPPTLLNLTTGELLGERLPVVQLPSLSLLNAEKRAQVEQPKRLLAVADPQYAASPGSRSRVSEAAIAMRGSSILGYFDALPETRQEVERIAKTFAGNATILVDQEATESRMKSLDLKQYSHIHLATHGVIGDELPGLFEPALILANEEGEDGLLSASEVAGLELEAELTVLSACNTGNGEYFNGEGLAGMGRAFMLAGSKNVIVSLWPVESFSTKRLMELLYTQLASGMTVPQALFEAQRLLRGAQNKMEATGTRGVIVGGVDEIQEPDVEQAQTFDNPFYWSPFVLISAG